MSALALSENHMNSGRPSAAPAAGAHLFSSASAPVDRVAGKNKSQKKKRGHSRAGGKI